MIETIAVGILALFSMYYVYFITRVRIGLLSLKYSQPLSFQPFVSVVIAARNEAKNIGRCLQSLVQQTYPTKSYEIIIVDDGSTDDTISVVKTYASRYSNIQVHSLPMRTDNVLGRKPLAIEKGINQSKGEIILTTDADCTVPTKWIEIMVNHFENDTIFVAGPVVEQVSSSFFAQLERLEFLGLVTTAAGLIGSHRPIICNGANIAYRKSAFRAVQGYSDTDSSNDDESLMNRMLYRKIGKVVFAPESDALVTTYSSNTIISFLRQRIRWANKHNHYEDKSILITLNALYFYFLSLAFTTVLLPGEPQLFLPLSIAFLGKVVVDYFTLKSGARLFLQRIPISYFLVAELLHVPYIVIVAAIGQFVSMHWKGRTIQR